MTDDTIPDQGATDDRRTETTSETDHASIEDLAAENRELQNRVEELESALESIRADIESGATNQGADTTTAATETDTESTPPLVTGGGQDCKVIGEFTSQSGIGVYGHNQATTGTATGVKGETDSNEDGATAVRGSAMASSGETYGVLGDTQSPTGNGVVGNASTNPPTAVPEPIGVYGHTDKSSEDSGVSVGYGVIGYADLPDNASGTAHGVVGWTTSSGDSSYGVFSLDDLAAQGNLLVGGNAEVGGDAEVDGAVNANADADRMSRVYFGDKSNPPGQLAHDNTEDTFSLSTNVKSGDTFEVKMDMELNQDGTPQRTGGPVAKGYIDSDATIVNGVNVASVSWVTDSGSNHYAIGLSEDNYWYDEYATYVTSTYDSGVSWSVTSKNSKLWVEPDDGNKHDFHFVTHKLISGAASTSNTTTSTPDGE